MSLHFPLMVNGRSIGQFEAVRCVPDDPRDRERRLQSYNVTITLSYSEQVVWKGSVVHDTNNGAWALVGIAIDAMNQELHPEWYPEEDQ